MTIPSVQAKVEAYRKQQEEAKALKDFFKECMAMIDLPDDFLPEDRQFYLWAKMYGFEVAWESIDAFIAQCSKKNQMAEEYEAAHGCRAPKEMYENFLKSRLEAVKYLSGIMRNKRNAGDAE
jgi:hypothetical protein